MLAAPASSRRPKAFSLLAAGADALKLFPAEAASPAVVKALLAVLPPARRCCRWAACRRDDRAVARGGRAGFGIGGSLYKPGDRPDVVGRRARALVGALAGG
jgi:2-dehydro-3-deoxyphosphogalactonate aldolase